MTCERAGNAIVCGRGSRRPAPSARQAAPRQSRSWPDLPLPDRPGAGWCQNLGRRPDGELKRVRVLLRHGAEPAYADALNPMAPPGWSADSTRWSLTGSPYDVAWYLPL